jgi:hypothetical protein
MTSKAEKLREQMLDGRGFVVGTVVGLDSLISVVDADAFERGKTEGVEQTKEMIRKAGEFVKENAPIPGGQFISESLSIGREVLLYADRDLFIIPASAVILDSEEEE